MIDKNDFIAADIFKLVSSFWDCTIGDQEKSSIRRRKYHIEMILKKHFQKVTLDQIDNKFVTKIFLELKNCVDIKTLIRFIHYLILNNVTFKNFEIFEAYYDVKLNVKACVSDVIQILTNPNFEEYFKRQFYSSREGVTLSFTNIKKEILMNESTRKCLEAYLESTKLDESMSVGTRLTNYGNSRKSLVKLFAKIDIKDMSRDLVCRLLCAAKEGCRANDIKTILRFTMFLAETNYLKDGRFEFLIKFRDYFYKGGYSIENLLGILSDPVPDKYRFYYTAKTKTKCRFIVYINCESTEIRNVLNDFLSMHGHTLAEIKKFCANFSESLGNNSVNTITDFNYSTFQSQLEYARKNMYSIDAFSLIVALYDYLSKNHNKEIFKPTKINPMILQRQSLSRELYYGYDIVLYNPIEEPPMSDKFLMHYTGEADTNTSVTEAKTTAINLEDINIPEYRWWIKHYLWKADPALYTKVQTCCKVKEMLRFVSGLKDGTIQSIYGRKSNDISITIRDALAYKTYIVQNLKNNKSQYAMISSSRRFLNHVVNNNLGVVESGAFYNLAVPADNLWNDNANPIGKDDLERLAFVINRRAEKSTYYFILSVVFYLALETEFRSSQILTLKTDCIREASKNNQYIIYSKRKNSAKQRVEDAITVYTKKHLESVIVATEELRNISQNSDIKQYIFIRPGTKNHSISLIKQTDVNNYLRDCCIEAGIKPYILSNLRDTHMTKAEEYIIRNSLSDLMQKILSGHELPETDRKHYVSLEIKDMMEAVHGVIIGNIDQKGQIVKELSREQSTPENMVSNQCGYCNRDICSDYSYLDCLLCKDFIATVDRIPFFEEQIKIIDNKIEKVKIIHDREDLINIKRLHVNYLNELINLQNGDALVQSEATSLKT